RGILVRVANQARATDEQVVAAERELGWTASVRMGDEIPVHAGEHVVQEDGRQGPVARESVLSEWIGARRLCSETVTRHAGEHVVQEDGRRGPVARESVLSEWIGARRLCSEIVTRFVLSGSPAADVKTTEPGVHVWDAQVGLAQGSV